MSKVIEGKEVRDRFRKGAKMLATAVGSTYGSGGNPVMLTQGQSSYLTKDGVSVAMNVKDVADKTELAAIRVLQETAKNTVDVGGDGTSAAIILTNAILQEGLNAVDAGYTPKMLQKGINLAAQEAINILDSIKLTISDKPEDEQRRLLTAVATTSSDNDEAMGKLVADAVFYAGKEGEVKADISNKNTTEVEYTKGIKMDSGHNRPELGEWQAENPLILFSPHGLNSANEVVPAIQFARKEGRPLLIIADFFNSEAKANILANAAAYGRGDDKGWDVFFAHSPSVDERREALMMDLCAYAAGTYMEERVTRFSLSNSKDRLKLAHFGTCAKVSVTDKQTMFIGGIESEGLEARKNVIRKQIENQEGDIDFLRTRLSKLLGKMAVIHVGAYTFYAKQEKFDRFDDAILATKAALVHGVVAGGGIAFEECSLMLSKVVWNDEHISNANICKGIEVVLSALLKPKQLLLSNAGIEKIEGLESYPIGYNTITEQHENFFETGILDSFLSTRAVILNACTNAGMLITTECVIEN